MNEQELREMIRASIARQVTDCHGVGSPFLDPAEKRTPDPVTIRHASFALLPLARGGDGDGACLIEPSVRCNHCGYCLSYGH